MTRQNFKINSLPLRRVSGSHPQKALNPPKGECRQCWYHAYASREEHKHLKPHEDCPACVDHMVNGHGNMIVGG